MNVISISVGGFKVGDGFGWNNNGVDVIETDRYGSETIHYSFQLCNKISEFN